MVSKLKTWQHNEALLIPKDGYTNILQETSLIYVSEWDLYYFHSLKLLYFLSFLPLS